MILYRYFNISYTLPKLDHLGLPVMGPGAMENWGLITYREKFLMVDDSSTPDMLQVAVLTVAHELGHQVRQYHYFVLNLYSMPATTASSSATSCSTTSSKVL